MNFKSVILDKNRIIFTYIVFVTLLAAALIYGVYEFVTENISLTNKLSEVESSLKGINPQVVSIDGIERPVIDGVENAVPCGDYIGSVTIPENTTCIYDGVRDLQTYSDIQVWSYSEKNWVEPYGVGDPKIKTIIKPNDTVLGAYYPIVIRCPWGCTLGYVD